MPEIWQVLKINESIYYFRQESQYDSIITTFSDMVCIWKETLSKKEVIFRFKICNPRAEASEDDILDFVLNLFQEENINAGLKKVDADMELMATDLLTKLKYECKLSKTSEEIVYKDLTLPLLIVINELKHRQMQLYEQLEAKDIELQEFKLEGCKITRRNVITTKFKREEFENEINSQVYERLKTGVGGMHQIITEDINLFYTEYQRMVQDTSMDLLKKGKILEEKTIVLPEVKEEKTIVEKRSLAEPLNVPDIKRSKLSKKRIL